MNVLASPGQLRASFLRWALFTVPTCVLLGFLAGNFAGGPDDPWFAALDKPAIYPPPAAFGIVWTILYVMMGLALALVCAAWGSRYRTPAILAFAAQFVINLAWTPVFFGAHQIAGGLAVIATLIVALAVTMWFFFKVRRVAGWLLVPYMAWVLFATALNWQFLQLNPEASGQEVSGASQRIAL